MKHLPHVLAREIDTKTTVVRPSYRRIFRFIGAIIAAIAFLPFIALVATKAPIAVTLLFLLGTAIYSALMTLIAREVVRVDLRADRISASDFWGFRRSLTWAEMESVEPAKLCGFPYLKVQSFRKSRKPIYIPLYFDDHEAFRKKVMVIAAPINPLRQALEKRKDKAVRAKAEA